MSEKAPHASEKAPHAPVEGPEEALDPARATPDPVGAEAKAEAKAEAPAKATPEAPTKPKAEAEAKAKAAPKAPEKDEREEKIAALEAREKELVDRLARLQADFENYRRRSREDIAQAATRGKVDFVKSLLPVLDNLDRALAHAEDEGLKLLAKHLQSTLAGAGLILLDPTGEAFDAKVHEAIAQEAREGVKSGTVVSTVEKGYALDGKVLRPARVVVAP